MFTLLSQFCLESPRWLLLRDRKKDAYEVLERIRSPTSNIEDEVRSVQKVFATVPTPLPNVLLALHSMFLQQFSGINMVIFHSTGTFKKAGLPLDPLVSSILVGALQVRRREVCLVPVAHLQSLPVWAFTQVNILIRRMTRTLRVRIRH